MKLLDTSTRKPNNSVFIGLFLLCLITMLWNYKANYSTSIDWEVVTTADAIEFPALLIEGGLMDHEVIGDKWVLSERYAGTRIKRSLPSDQMYLAITWIGLCIVLCLATYSNQYLFFSVLAAFALLINRLNLFEVGLFGITSKLVMLVPFLCLSIPLIYFKEFNKNVPLGIRIATLVIISALICLGIKDGADFTNHFLAHSLFPFAICFLIFLFFISEEIGFALLFVATSSKGKQNPIHYILLSVIYLGNLTLYYLNKSGFYENTFALLDPFILLGISSLVATWSLRYKTVFNRQIPQPMQLTWFAGFGIMALGCLSLFMSKGVDGIYQSLHYFILYFHLGFGVLFFLYTISNFLDPLIKGFPIWKIAYRERNFPYASAKIGGFVCVAAFYFLADQEPYNLLRSGHYALLGDKQYEQGNELLGKEYWLQAAFLGYNTHYPNYKLGWTEWDKRKGLASKSHFFSAAQRFPSPYAWVNYGNQEVGLNPTKVQAVYEESLRKISSPEMTTNLGLIHLEKENYIKALSYFESVKASDSWNDAPTVNQWKTFASIDSIPADYRKVYAASNFGVKANILATADSTPGDFVFSQLDQAPPLHRQAYVLNAAYLLSHDSIPSVLRSEISKTLNPTLSSRLSKALALNYYHSGQVNKALRVLDHLQSSANTFEKGEYLDVLGKLTLDQNAFDLSLAYFNGAIAVKREASRLSRLDVIAALGDTLQFESELLKIVKKNPELTHYANDLLSKFQTYLPKKKQYPSIPLEELSDTNLYLVAKRNAFDVKGVLASVEELKKRKAEGGYDILIEAIEINKYAPELLKAYIFSALDWGLINYTVPVLERLKKVISKEDYSSFEEAYKKKIIASKSEEWK